LTEKGVEYRAVNYLKDQLSPGELKKLLKSAGLKPLEVMRSKEPAFQELVAGKKLSDNDLIRILVEHPELIQRPLVVRGGKVVLARPIERLKELGIK